MTRARKYVSVYLEQDQCDGIDELAETLGWSKAEVMRRGIDLVLVEHGVFEIEQEQEQDA